MCVLVVFKQKTGYEMRISEWSSDVCSSDRAQGLTLFSLNYLLFYVATGYVTSGLVAVAFSTITIMNIGNGALLFRTPIDRRVVFAALAGIVGLGQIGRAHV